MSLLPQVGFFELITVAVIALIVVGPKDLPRLMGMAGKMMRQARTLAAEFTAAFDQMARETEMEEMRKEIDALKNDNVFAQTKKSLDDAIKPIDDAVRGEAAELNKAVSKPVAAPAKSPDNPPAKASDSGASDV